MKEESSEEESKAQKNEIDDEMLPDGVTRLVSGKHYRRTANGQWREVDPIFGLFSERPPKDPKE